MLRAQDDTLVRYDRLNDQFLLCDNPRISEGAMIDSNNCYKYYIYSTEIKNLFFFKANYLRGSLYAKGYGKHQVGKHKILFVKFTRRENDILFEGTWSFYFPDGKVKIKGNYSAGKKEGTWQYYDESGRLVKEENYTQGELKT